MKALGLNWSIGSDFGWGTYGLELTLQPIRRGARMPLLLQPSGPLATDGLQTARLDVVKRASTAALEGTGRFSLSGPGNGPVAAHAIVRSGSPSMMS